MKSVNFITGMFVGFVIGVLCLAMLSDSKAIMFGVVTTEEEISTVDTLDLGVSEEVVKTDAPSEVLPKADTPPIIPETGK